MFVCKKCKSSFATAAMYLRHQKQAQCATSGPRKKFSCTTCGKQFNRKATLKLHYRMLHGEVEAYLCTVCDRVFHSREDFREHKREHNEQLAQEPAGFKRYKAAHRGACMHFRLVFPEDTNSVQAAFTFMSPHLIRLIKHQLQTMNFFKLNICLMVQMKKSIETGDTDDAPADEVQGRDVILAPMRAPGVTITRGTDLSAVIADAMMHIQTFFDEFLANGSGWVEDHVVRADVEFAKCQPLAGSCSLHELKLCYGKLGKKVITTKQEEHPSAHHCFFLAIAAYFMQKKNVDKTDLSSLVELGFNLDGVQVPVHVSEIDKFEAQNDHLDININVIYKDEEDDIFPVRAGPHPFAANQICLLLFFSTSAALHYALVRDPSKILGKVLGRGSNMRQRRVYHCFNCFYPHASEDALKNHVRWCHKKNSQLIVYPQEGEVLQFKDHHKCVKTSFNFFFDFETGSRIPLRKCGCLQGEICTHKTETIYEQYAVGYSLIIVDSGGEVFEHVQYIGDDAAEHFLNTILDFSVTYAQLSDKIEDMIISPEEEEAFEQATVCDHCHLEFTEDNGKVKHHDHKSGVYAGALHSHCNLRLMESLKLIGWAHNFSS